MLTLLPLNLYVGPDSIVHFLLIKFVGPGFPTTLWHFLRQQLHQSHTARRKLLRAGPGPTHRWIHACLLYTSQYVLPGKKG